MNVTFLSLTDLDSMDVEIERARIKLAEAEQNLEPELLRVLMEGAEQMVIEAKNIVRVDTGSLQKSIRTERKGKLSVAIRAGGYVVNPKTGKYVNYAGIIEQRYPYLRPAYELIEPFLREEIDRVVSELLRNQP